MKQLRTLALAGWPAIAAATTVWLAAIFCLLGAQSAIRLAMQGQQSEALLNADGLPKIVTSATPLMEADYKAVVTRLAPVPGVTVAGSASGVVVEAKDLSSYEAWQAAVSEVMLTGEGVNWVVKKMCTGECQGKVFTALVTGARRTALLNS